MQISVHLVKCLYRKEGSFVLWAEGWNPGSFLPRTSERALSNHLKSPVYTNENPGVSGHLQKHYSLGRIVSYT